MSRLGRDTFRGAHADRRQLDEAADLGGCVGPGLKERHGAAKRQSPLHPRGPSSPFVAIAHFTLVSLSCPSRDADTGKARKKEPNNGWKWYRRWRRSKNQVVDFDCIKHDNRV